MQSAMSQAAPWPLILEDLVAGLVYRPGWSFTLGDLDRGQGSKGLTLSILVQCQDSYDHDKRRSVVHYMLVPPAAYNRRSWQNWLFEQCLLVERHEACEFFTIDGVKSFAPNHAPGNDPYLIVTLGTAEDAATDSRGKVKE